MELHLRYFAAARDATGVADERVEVADGTSIAGLRALLVVRHPKLARVLAQSRLAVAQRFVNDDHVLPHEKHLEVAVIPPVAGG
jgi:molybdopterin synthase sulfur carrier subunit